MMAEMKHRIVHALQKYLLNPPIKLLFALGVVPPGFALSKRLVARPARRAALPWVKHASASGYGSWQNTA